MDTFLHGYLVSLSCLMSVTVCLLGMPPGLHIPVMHTMWASMRFYGFMVTASYHDVLSWY